LREEGQLEWLMGIVSDEGRMAIEERRRAGPIASLKGREDPNQEVGDRYPRHDPDRAARQLLVEVHRVLAAEDPHVIASRELSYRGDLRGRRRLLQLHVAA